MNKEAVTRDNFPATCNRIIALRDKLQNTFHTLQLVLLNLPKLRRYHLLDERRLLERLEGRLPQNAVSEHDAIYRDRLRRGLEEVGGGGGGRLVFWILTLNLY